ncbi:hypothetical protein [Muricomes intestini]|uniref:hypothetical protein n=1 Tax=Muricomes intestini TaxID=1796634 RepID=UPI002FD93D87
MLKEMITILMELPDCIWDSYAFSREPLNGRLTDGSRRKYARLAHQTGCAQAKETKTAFPQLTMEEIIQKLNIDLKIKNIQDDGNYIMFACYMEPNQILVYKKPIQQTIELLHQKGCENLISENQMQEILLAHELFHWYEYQKTNLPTSQKVLSLWKIGPLENKSRLVSLGEIAAMAFAKEMLGLSYSPYTLDILLLLTINLGLARELYNTILGLAGLPKCPDEVWEEF